MDFLYDGDETASFGFDPQEEMISEDLTPVGDPYSSGESWEYIDSDNNGVVDMAIADIDVEAIDRGLLPTLPAASWSTAMRQTSISTATISATSMKRGY